MSLLLQIGSDLLVFKGDTVEVLASLVKEWNVTQVSNILQLQNTVIT